MGKNFSEQFKRLERRITELEKITKHLVETEDTAGIQAVGGRPFLSITRYHYDDTCTRGELELCIPTTEGHKVYYTCDVLENPWLDNKPYVSCIPTGTYGFEKRTVGEFYARYNRKFGA